MSAWSVQDNLFMRPVEIGGYGLLDDRVRGCREIGVGSGAMRWAWGSFIAIVAMGFAVGQEAPAGISAGDAWRDKGKTENVCGLVVDSAWLDSIANAPTYLYLERPRPEQVFTVVIPAAKRSLFGDNPEKSLRGKGICVTGKIEADGVGGAVDRNHRARIVVEEEEQITVR